MQHCRNNFKIRVYLALRIGMSDSRLVMLVNSWVILSGHGISHGAIEEVPYRGAITHVKFIKAKNIPSWYRMEVWRESVCSLRRRSLDRG
ncbi:hypothetical protein TNCV_21781 [Trichonephila clavipes]|nr:hypothetical protein TNCV_21781 [Trichonephila clavipes]